MKRIFSPLLICVMWVYFAILFCWLGLYLVSGDRFVLVALANLAAVYLFAPLPVVGVVAAFLRRRELWASVTLGAAAFAWLWGGLFLPKPSQALAVEGNGPRLAVMTYNVLGRQAFHGPQIETILAENADVVLIQELTPALARAVQSELIEAYPHQALAPEEGVSGLGVLSKFPLTPTGQQLSEHWLGEPQVLRLDWHGRAITLVNFHMYSTPLVSLAEIARVNRLREAQAEALADFARRTGRLVAAGDANATPLSQVYKTVTNVLNDAWRAAGFGLGHTFPGSDLPGSSRPHLFGWPLPMWLARIDYVFYSSEWRAAEARLARFDGVSDHRSVVAVLLWEGD